MQLLVRASTRWSYSKVTYRRSTTQLITVLQVAAFRRRVQFTAAAAAVPEGAVLLEVGPHSLLRGPLRQGARAKLAFTELAECMARCCPDERHADSENLQRLHSSLLAGMP